MTRPDPEAQPYRRKLWVDKTAAINPPPLGITMGDTGNEYDFNPPTEAETMASKVGRPKESTDKARQFIQASLEETNHQQATALCSIWESKKGSASSFWRARTEMVKDGSLSCEGKPLVMRLFIPD
jgi:hypothetical protein